MTKTYKIKANEKLFNDWMRVCASPHSKVGLDTWAIVQNDIELTTDQLNEWYIRTGKMIDDTQKYFDDIIKEMKSIRKRTVGYIQITNE